MIAAIKDSQTDISHTSTASHTGCDWYVHVENRLHGPYAESQIRQGLQDGRIAAGMMVRQGSGQWHDARLVGAAFDRLASVGYYVKEAGVEQGPFTEQKIREFVTAGELSPLAFARQGNEKKWQPVCLLLTFSEAGQRAGEGSQGGRQQTGALPTRSGQREPAVAQPVTSQSIASKSVVPQPTAPKSLATNSATSQPIATVATRETRAANRSTCLGSALVPVRNAEFVPSTPSVQVTPASPSESADADAFESTLSDQVPAMGLQPDRKLAGRDQSAWLQTAFAEHEIQFLKTVASPLLKSGLAAVTLFGITGYATGLHGVSALLGLLCFGGCFRFVYALHRKPAMQGWLALLK